MPGLRRDRNQAAATIWPAPRAPAPVPHEVGGDPEEIGATVGFALPVAARPQEPVEAFLQQIVGDVRVAGHPRQIAPERPCRAVVERAEGVFVHLEWHVDLCSLEPFDVGESQIAHGSLVMARALSMCSRGGDGRFEEAQAPREEE